jgi:hypothetical protein
VLVRDGVHVDAIPLAYNHAGFLERFLARWPEGSPAHASYFRRIAFGPGDWIEQARPRDISHHADAFDHRPGA